MADHQLESHLGERSPLAKLYDRDAQVLMLGVGYGYCTAMHLAEYRYTARPPRQTYTCVVTTDGRRGWIGYHDVVLDDNDFEEIGKSLAAEIAVGHGYVGHAECCLMSLRDTVDFAVKWMAEYRQVDPELMRVGDLCKLLYASYSYSSYPMRCMPPGRTGAEWTEATSPERPFTTATQLVRRGTPPVLLPQLRAQP